jgi:sec-independent protein translocase protein TatA
MGLSLPHLIVVLLIVLLIFGAGKLPRIMGDIGKGVRSLREGLKGDEVTKIEDKDKHNT